MSNKRDITKKSLPPKKSAKSLETEEEPLVETPSTPEVEETSTPVETTTKATKTSTRPAKNTRRVVKEEETVTAVEEEAPVETPKKGRATKGTASKINKKKVPTKKGSKSESEDDSSPKKRGPRRVVTYENHMQKFDELIKLIDEEIDRKSKDREKGVRTLRSINKMVKELQKDSEKISHRRRQTKNGNSKVSGFNYPCRISKELADFLGKDEEFTPTRKEITNAICVYCHVKPDEKRDHMKKWMYLNPEGKRNLQSPENKMIIFPDDKLKKLFKYNQYQKDVKSGKIVSKRRDKKTGEETTVKIEDDGLRYCVFQRLIKPHILETLSVEKAVEE